MYAEYYFVHEFSLINTNGFEISGNSCEFADSLLGFALVLPKLDAIALTLAPQKKKVTSLCYNAANMNYQSRFATNNNDDNDDPLIVGRSLAE